MNTMETPPIYTTSVPPFNTARFTVVMTNQVLNEYRPPDSSEATDDAPISITLLRSDFGRDIEQ